jgi:hypothetical protein
MRYLCSNEATSVLLRPLYYYHEATSWPNTNEASTLLGANARSVLVLLSVKWRGAIPSYPIPSLSHPISHPHPISSIPSHPTHHILIHLPSYPKLSHHTAITSHHIGMPSHHTLSHETSFICLTLSSGFLFSLYLAYSSAHRDRYN